MASVWKRLQRVNKRAAKFQYTASYHRIDLETSPKWKPNKLSVVWTRRSRRVITEPMEWEPSLKDPLKGSVVFSAPENQTVTVTLFKDSRTNELEDKDWTFVLEDVSVTGKRRRLAVSSINMRKFASLEPTARAISVPLDPTTHKVAAAAVHLTLHCVLLREGQATDEDMQSLASLLSVNNNSDIAVLEDLDEDDTYTLSDHSTRQMLDLRQQMEELTQSLSGSAATPCSVQSLVSDPARTPTATPAHTPPHHQLENTPKFEPKKTEFKTSTPTEKIDNFKEVIFKPKTVAKRNLKPLELKTNLNSIALDRNDNEEEDVDKTPTADMEKLFPKLDKDKTPVADLLEWCQNVTREYRACRVTNLTTSFRSGLAFCAIIHHYRPDLIDFSGLQPEDAENNVRCALEASAALGISQVLTVGDVCARPAADRLAIMTYLFQLRAHFTGNELQVEQLGNDETESSYLVGRHDTDGALPRDLFSREVSARRSRNDGRTRPLSLEMSSAPRVPPAPARPRTPEGTLRGVLGRVLPANTERNKPSAKWFTSVDTEPIPARPEKLMTRKELTDPFGSDEEDEEKNPPHHAVNGNDAVKPESKPPTIEPATTDPLTSLQPEPTRNHPFTFARLPPLQPDNPQPNQPQPDKVASESNNSKQPIERQLSDQQPLETRTQPFDKSQPSDKSQLSNKSQPFDKSQPNPLLASPDLPKPTPQLLSRHDELKERARQLLEATKREAREKDRMRRQNSKEKEEKENGHRNGDVSPKKPMSEEERQAMLRERARKLIADARAGIVSPSPPLSPGRRGGAVEIISRASVMEELAAAGGMEQLDALLARECSTPNSRNSLSPDRSEGRNSEDTKSVKSVASGEERRSPLHSFSALVDRLTPDKDNDEKAESGSYIASELEALEREQQAIDTRAAALEKLLRAVMEGHDNTEEEAHLMSQWFNLVNKKNALLRRQMQLNILEQEEDLSRRCELLARELRLSLGVDEWRKTPGQKRRERLLLQELLSAVNERDRLVQEMDEQERAIADDDAIERNLSQVEIQRKNNCILQ